VGEALWGLLSFVALVCVWLYFCCCSVGCLCQGLQRFGSCKFGTVGLSAVGGSGSALTGWKRM
jgi:hypothetical protein